MTRGAGQRVVGATSLHRWVLRAAGVTLASAGAVFMSAAVASADDKDGHLAPLTSTVEKAEKVVEPVAEPAGKVPEKVEPVAEPAGKVAEKVVEPVAEPAGKVPEKVVEPVAEPAGKVPEKVVEPVAEPAGKVPEKVVEPAGKVAEKVVEPVVDAVEPVLAPVADTLKPANEVVGEAVMPLVPVVEPIVDAVAPVVEGVAQGVGEVLPPIGVIVPSGDDSGPRTLIAVSPSSPGTTTPDASALYVAGPHAAALEDSVVVGYSGMPAHRLDQATSSLSTPRTASAAASDLPLGIGAAGSTSGSTPGGDTVALPVNFPIQSAGTWLLPARDAFSSLPSPAYEIPVSPA